MNYFLLLFYVTIQFCNLLIEKYEKTEETSDEIKKELERQDSYEKQKVYEDAFLEQMERYSKLGELESKIFFRGYNSIF